MMYAQIPLPNEPAHPNRRSSVGTVYILVIIRKRAFHEDIRLDMLCIRVVWTKALN